MLNIVTKSYAPYCIKKEPPLHMIIFSISAWKTKSEVCPRKLYGHVCAQQFPAFYFHNEYSFCRKWNLRFFTSYCLMPAKHFPTPRVKLRKIVFYVLGLNRVSKKTHGKCFEPGKWKQPKMLTKNEWKIILFQYPFSFCTENATPKHTQQIER